MIDTPLTTAAIMGAGMTLGLWVARKLRLSFEPPPERWKFPAGEVFLLAWMIICLLTVAGLGVVLGA